MTPFWYNDDDVDDAPGVCANYSHAHEAPDAEAAREQAQHAEPEVEPAGSLEPRCACDCEDEHSLVDKCECCCHEVDQYALITEGRPWTTRYVCCHCYVQEHRRCDGQRGSGEACECTRCARDAEGGA